MIRARSGLAFVFLICISACLGAPERTCIDGVTYHILKVSPDRIRLLWKGDDGKPLHAFPAAATYLKRRGMVPEVLMNGGIFEPGGTPSGLLVENGKETNPVNRNQGRGNFFLQPNGIFQISDKGAAVIRTDEYPLKNVLVREAVQSGPLLLRSGIVHPAFDANSTSKLHRNGIGVTKAGEVVLAMTDFDSSQVVNLFNFAQLFKSLGCDDALYLDGTISQMRAGSETGTPSNRFGSILAVVKAGN